MRHSRHSVAFFARGREASSAAFEDDFEDLFELRFHLKHIGITGLRVLVWPH